jgi:hypothetical protein
MKITSTQQLFQTWFIDACWDDTGREIARELLFSREIFNEYLALEIKPHPV